MRARFLLPITLVALFAVPSAARAATETLHREHSFQARAEVTVEIDVSFHEVEVAARPGDTVEVTVDLEVSGSRAKRTIDELDPVFRDDGDRLLIRSTRRGGLSWGFTRTKGRVVVEMPPGLDLEVDSSSGRTVIRVTSRVRPSSATPRPGVSPWRERPVRSPPARRRDRSISS